MVYICYLPYSVVISVVDPDLDPYVFWSLGSGSVIICLSTSKKSKKKLNFYYILDFFWLFFFEDWCVKVLSTSNQQKTLKKYFFVVGVLSATDEKSRIRIPETVWKCDWSTTLRNRYNKYSRSFVLSWNWKANLIWSVGISFDWLISLIVPKLILLQLFISETFIFELSSSKTFA